MPTAQLNIEASRSRRPAFPGLRGLRLFERGITSTSRFPSPRSARNRVLQEAKDLERASALHLSCRTGIAAADFSPIRNADLGRFAVDRLMSSLNRLGARVEVKVRVRRAGSDRSGLVCPLSKRAGGYRRGGQKTAREPFSAEP
jgi:hypothetical protein